MLIVDDTTIDAKTQHLPPTLSLQYHFDGYNIPMNVKPFFVVGVKCTTFFKEKIYSDTYKNLKLDDNVGVAGKTLDADEVDISPWVYAVAFVKYVAWHL